jgi:hypothetical protein
MNQRCDAHFIWKRRPKPRGLLGKSARKSAVICGSVIVGLLGASCAASAATVVSGQPEDVQLSTENASTKEVLDALSAAFKITYKLPPNTGRDVTGVYSGTLRQVLARILDGNDYIVKVADNGIEVLVLGASGAASAATGQAIVMSENTAAASLPASPPTVPVSKPTLLPSTPTLPAASLPPPLASYLSANGP